MPAITLPIETGGPVVSVMVGMSMPRLSAMQAAGLPTPQMITGRFLVDTGASSTCVDPALIAPLGLPQIGTVAISTPSTNGQQHFCQQFDCALYIPGPVNTFGHFIEALPIITTHLQSQGIDGLIGRDVLSRCTLTYIGSAGLISLSF